MQIIVVHKMTCLQCYAADAEKKKKKKLYPKITLQCINRGVACKIH